MGPCIYVCIGCCARSMRCQRRAITSMWCVLPTLANIHMRRATQTSPSYKNSLSRTCLHAPTNTHTHTHACAHTHTNTSIQVRYFNAWEQEDKLYIQMELCKGSLADLRKKQGPLAEPQLSDIMVQVACPSWLCHGLIAHTPFHPPVSQPATAL